MDSTLTDSDTSTAPATESLGSEAAAPRPSRSTAPRDGRRGDGRIYRRPNSSVLWCRYYYAGQDHRESTGETDERKARKFLRDRLDDVGADRKGLRKFIPPAAQRMTAAELLDALKADYTLRAGRALAQVLAHCRPIRETFGHRRAASVTAVQIDAYISSRLAGQRPAGAIDTPKAKKAMNWKKAAKPATVNRETQLLGQAFRLGVERQCVAAAPTIRRLPERNVRTGFFERADFDGVVAALPADLVDVARFAYLSGWRRGEILTLRWSDVDRDGRVIRLRAEESKNGHGRVLVLESDLAALIERRAEVRPVKAEDGTTRLVELVFHRGGCPIVDFRKAWRTACTKAFVPGRLLHDCRRTAARNLVRAGVNERVAMAVTGHRIRSMFDRYNIVSESDLREAATKAQAYVDAQPTTRTVIPLKTTTG